MRAHAWLSRGIPAGLMAGVAVAVFFLIGDVLRLSPLATPLSLGEILMAPGGFEVDLPVLAQLVAVVSYGASLVAFTLLHLLVFAALGVGAVAWFDLKDKPLTAKSGALYGLVVCTVVFYAGLLLPMGAVAESVPGLWSVLAANVVAGAVIGGCAEASKAEEA